MTATATLAPSPFLQMARNGDILIEAGVVYLKDGQENIIVNYDDVDWKLVGEDRAMHLLCQTFLTNNRSALATLRMFDSAIKGFKANSPEASARISAELEDRIEVLLAKHLEGIGLSISEYLNHSGDFTSEQAVHLSDFARWRFRSVTDEFPGTLGQVLGLTLHHLNASPERVRAQIAANNR